LSEAIKNLFVLILTRVQFVKKDLYIPRLTVAAIVSFVSFVFFASCCWLVGKMFYVMFVICQMLRLPSTSFGSLTPLSLPPSALSISQPEIAGENLVWHRSHRRKESRRNPQQLMPPTEMSEEDIQ